MATQAQAIAARARRLARNDAKIEWFGREVRRNINLGMRDRLRIAGQLLRDRVVTNISRPVVKYGGGRDEAGRFIAGARRGKRRVDPTSRSRPGEYPRADTTRLMKDIFFEVQSGSFLRGPVAIVGTTLDYGLILEVSMNRSFLRRTLREVAPRLRGIISTPRRFPGELR